MLCLLIKFFPFLDTITTIIEAAIPNLSLGTMKTVITTIMKMIVRVTSSKNYQLRFYS